MHANGVVASLAVTEFMLSVAGIREPNRLLTYHGRTGKVTVSINDDLLRGMPPPSKLRRVPVR